MSKFIRLKHQGDLADFDLDKVAVVRRIVSYTTDTPPQATIVSVRLYMLGEDSPYCFNDTTEMTDFLSVWDKYANAQEPGNFTP